MHCERCHGPVPPPQLAGHAIFRRLRGVVPFCLSVLSFLLDVVTGASVGKDIFLLNSSIA